MSAHQSGTLGLTEKNMAFARAVFLDYSGKKSRAEHYQDVFGGSANATSLCNMASRLWREPAIVAYVEMLREDMRERYLVTMEGCVAELEEARQVGFDTKSAAAMVAATMGKAKLAGLDKVVVDHQSSDGSMSPRTFTEMYGGMKNEENGEP